MKEVIFLPRGKNNILRGVKLAGGILPVQIKIGCHLRLLTRQKCGEMQCGKGFYN